MCKCQMKFGNRYGDRGGCLLRGGTFRTKCTVGEVVRRENIKRAGSTLAGRDGRETLNTYGDIK